MPKPWFVANRLGDCIHLKFYNRRGLDLTPLMAQELSDALRHLIKEKVNI